MTELLALIPTTAALIAAVFFYHRESAAWRAERADLLNRLMARDWTEYRAMTHEPPHYQIPQFSTDELESLWYESQRREGAAVNG